MRWCFAVMLLTGLGSCGLVSPTSASLEAVAVAHLEARYGATFSVKLLPRSAYNVMRGGNLALNYPFEAYPTQDPSLVFEGTVSTFEEPYRVRDTYPCVQMARYLPGLVLDELGPGHLLLSHQIECAQSEKLPAYPLPTDARPGQGLSVTMDIAAFHEGEPGEVAKAACARAAAAGSTLGMKMIGRCMALPPLWLQAEDVLAALASGKSDEEVDAFALARAPSRHPELAPVVYRRDAAFEERVAQAVAPAASEMRVGVWAQVDVKAGRYPNRTVDVRVARPGLTLAEVEAVREALVAMPLLERWTLVGLDTAGPKGPQQGAFRCDKHRCTSASPPLFDPSLFVTTAEESAP